MDVNVYKLQIYIWRRFALLILFGLLFNITAGAQTISARKLVSFGASSGLADDTLYLDIDQDIAVQLVPFDELVKVAIQHSPLIKYQNEITTSLSSGYELTKVQILQNLGGSANYSTGNQTILASGGSIRPGESTLGQIANGYRVGVDLRISLFDLFGRKHQIRQAQANYRASIVQKETIELQIKQQLISVYQDMITVQQILKLRLIDEQASLAAYRVAEVESQKGRISAELLADATSRYVQSKSSTEQTKGDFLKNVHFFEALVGVPIQRLKRN
jgi:outer membrane protein TolC